MASELEGHESARSIWAIMKSTLTNQRGEVGVEDSSDDGGDWNAEGELAEGDQIKEPADQVKALPITEPKAKAEPQEEEQEESEPEVEAEAEEEVEEEEEETGDNQEVAAMRAELESLKQMNTFWQSKYNEVTSRQTQPAQKAAQAQQATPEEFEEPPESWESTNDVVSFFDKRSNVKTQQAMEQGFKQYVQPMFEKFNTAMVEVINRTIKPSLKDYDSIIKDVNDKHLFVMDPTGEKAVAIRNQSLLDYFMAQPVPQLAMYDWGLSQKAPQKIKEGTQKAQKDLISKLKKKPKAPKQIQNASQQPEQGGDELDWDTPDTQVEKILSKKRLI